MTKNKTISVIQYDDCADCSFLELPDENGEIKCPDYILRLARVVRSKSGSLIPNPIIGRCGVDGKRLTVLKGCSRWFDKNDRIVFCSPATTIMFEITM